MPIPYILFHLFFSGICLLLALRLQGRSWAGVCLSLLLGALWLIGFINKAFVSFFEKRAKFPKFKSRKRVVHSFRIPQNVLIVDGKVSVPKIGLVKVRLHREMEGEIKSATIKQEPSGHWNVTLDYLWDGYAVVLAAN